MNIVGLDLSPKSPGCFKYKLNNDMNPVEFEFMGFTDVKKNEQEGIHFYHKDKTFNNYIDREEWMLNKIVAFCYDVDYIAIEDYAFNATGRVFHIAEFAGLVKHRLYMKGKKIRLYDPGSIKIFASSRGNCDKITMYDSFIKDKGLKFDLNKLPEVKKSSGKSPTSDLIDAYYVCNLLKTELTIRKGLKTVKDYNEDVIKVFNRVTTAHPENILASDFLELTEAEK